MSAIAASFCLAMTCSATAVLGAPSPAVDAPQSTLAALLADQLSSSERLFVDAAEAMPEDKYTFAPTAGEFGGVRTFAEQVKHVAYYNYLTFAIMLGENPPPEADAENGPASVRTKAEVLKYVRDSFAVGRRAVAAVTMGNVIAPIEGQSDPPHGATRLQQMLFVVHHVGSHYGQIVEYLRMNRIVPPASRTTGQ